MHEEIVSRLLYPDPFKPVGLEVDLPDAGRVTLRILHEDGSEPKTLIENAFYEKGKHVLSIGLLDIAGGSRLYQLLIEMDGITTVETKKIC
ncbi:MAG: hypothetical protein ACHQQQ_07170 [Bacteroidota bacterium]